MIGKAGSGKTTLLRNMILQHITLGHGVGLIDPHGDLAKELLNHIPPHRADHLAYFNPGDLEYRAGWGYGRPSKPITLNFYAPCVSGRDEWRRCAAGR